MNSLKIIPLGGMGGVTQNMFLYEMDQEILIIDCGIGFPDHYMPGADILIPDISYLLKKIEEGKTVVGMILSHGHDDHIGALPYLLPALPDFPIFASPLTAGFAEDRMKESSAKRTVTVIDHSDEFTIGQGFTVQLFAVTHSVPHTRHILVKTEAGNFYHGSDFKLDPSPVDGVLTDIRRISEAVEGGITCLLLDCLRVENPNWVASESTVGPILSDLMLKTEGKYVITLMSSHLHRIQQVIDAAVSQGRKVAFIGRSVEQNVEVALRLNVLTIPAGTMVDKRKLSNYPDKQLCVIVAGSQGQEGSSLVRAIFGEHRALRISPNDTVVFSADAIPGNELPYYAAIDELCRNRIHVVYPAIAKGIHQSGHASAPEQQEMVRTIKPTYLFPMGGADRHRVLFLEKVAEPLGYNENSVLIPESGEILEFGLGSPRTVEKIMLKPQIVDGLGVGDVGPIVLSDRRAMAESGIIVLVIPRENNEFLVDQIEIVSRGFVFMKEAEEVISFIQESTIETIDKFGTKSDEVLKKEIEKRLARKLFSIIRREPMIVPVIIDR
ncbi:MAG: ribonuclease J [Microgenomates group bacterium]